MVDKFWNFLRGSAARWRERGRTRRAGRTALPGRPRSRSRPSAVHATCALVRRARRRARAAAGRILVWVAPRCGMRGSCAGTEWLSDDGPHVRPRTGALAQTSAARAHARARAPGNARVGEAVNPLTLAPCSSLHWWRCHARLRSVLRQMRATCRRDGVRTSWSLGTAAPGLDGARCAVGRTDL